MGRWERVRTQWVPHTSTLPDALPQVDAGMQASQYKGRSTGLGLAISRRIALAHHGEIGVRSTPGVGSEFFFRFPAVQGSSLAPVDEAHIAASGIAGRSTSSGAFQLALHSVSPDALAGGPLGQRALDRTQYRASDKGAPDAFDDDRISTDSRLGDSGDEVANGASAAPAAPVLPQLRLLVVDDSATNLRSECRTASCKIGSRD